MGTRSDSENGAPKAFALLGTPYLSSARRKAGRLLKRTLRWSRGAALPGPLFERLGSTLFLDDDPDKLANLFESSDRELFTPRILAAFIVLYGRPRVLLVP